MYKVAFLLDSNLCWGLRATASPTPRANSQAMKAGEKIVSLNMARRWGGGQLLMRGGPPLSGAFLTSEHIQTHHWPICLRELTAQVYEMWQKKGLYELHLVQWGDQSTESHFWNLLLIVGFGVFCCTCPPRFHCSGTWAAFIMPFPSLMPRK